MAEDAAEKQMSTDTAPLAQRNLGRNASLLLVHGLLGQTGFRLLQAPTFLPAFVQQLTGTDWSVGAARAAQSLGMFLSPLLGAGAIGRRRRVRGLTMVFGFAMRIQVGLLALLALAAPLSLTRALIWPTLFGWGLASGLQAVTFNVLLAKSVPVRIRGRLWGARNLGSGLSLLVVSALAGSLLERYGFPRGFGFTFLVAFALTSSGLGCLIFLREPAARRTAGPELLGLGPRVRAAGSLLVDQRLGPFLRTVALVTASRGALPYFIVAIGERSAVDGSLLALLTVVFALSQAVSSLLWGGLADRAGFRIVYRLSVCCWLLASLLVLATDGVEVATLLFLLLGAGLAGTMLCQSSMVLEFGHEGERALNVAASSSLAEGAGTLGFVIAALLTRFSSVELVFLLSALLQVIALAQTARLAEPRAETAPLPRDG